MKVTAEMWIKAGLGALLFLASAGSVTGAGAAEIIVYEDAFYTGASRHYRDEVRNLDDENFNDRISSIRVVSGFWTVCSDAYFSGRCERVSGDVSNLASTGLNDRISSIRLEGGGDGYRDGDGRGYQDDYFPAGLVLYSSPDFDGRSIRIDRDTPRLGQYNFNDRTASIRVEGGTWEICRDGDFRGRCEIIADDVRNLDVFNLKNEISSVRLIRRDRDGWDDADTWWDRDRHERWDRWEDRADYRAVVYEHTDYRGEERRFNGGIPDLTQLGFNDRISSFRLEGRWEVCEHVNFGGACEIFRYDEPNLVPHGWNDRISSLRPIGWRNMERVGLVLFEDVNFRGDRQRLRDDEPDLREVGFNDVASSLRVREGRWELCEHTQYRGHCHIFDSNDADLIPDGLNDRVSSVRRLDRDRPDEYGGITVYEHTNYEGRRESFAYDIPNLDAENFNDILSSFRIDAGTWELCEHANYGGRCWTFSEDVANVVPLGMNDRISSLRRIGGGYRDENDGYYDDDRYDDDDYGGGYRDAYIRVFEHTDYEGRSRMYTEDAQNLALEGWNDQISSFEIRGPGRWELCDDAYYGGRCQLFSSDEPNLVPLNWNDRISSIRYLP